MQNLSERAKKAKEFGLKPNIQLLTDMCTVMMIGDRYDDGDDGHNDSDDDTCDGGVNDDDVRGDNIDDSVNADCDYDDDPIAENIK